MPTDPAQSSSRLDRLLEEPTLEELRGRGPASEREALAWARALTAQISLLHQEGRVDGALNGRRVLCLIDHSEDGREIRECRILPAADQDPEDPAVASCLAPEQLAGGRADAGSDIYAVGVMLYSLVTGRLPFAPGDREGRKAQGSGVWRLVRANPILPSQRVPQLSRIWDAVLIRALELDPLDRFASAADLDSALHGRPVIPGRRQLLERRERKRRKKRRIFIGALCTAALGAGLFFRNATTRPSAESIADVEILNAGAETAETEPRRALAVLGFSNRSDAADDWISTALAEMLASEMAADDALRVVSGDQTASMKLDLGLRLDQLAQKEAEAIQERLGADLLVFGTYRTESAGGEPAVRLDLRLLDLHSGNAPTTVSESAPTNRLTSLVRRVGARLRADLGLGDENVSIDVAQTAPQGEAARLYAEGLDHLRRFDALGARDLLERAAEAQSSSPQILLALADTLSELGEDEAATKAARGAHESAVALPRAERLYIEGRYREMNRDWTRAIEIYQILWQLYPDEIDHGLRLAAAQTAAGDHETLQTVDLLLAAAPDDPRVALAEAEAAELASDYGRKREAALRAVEAGERSGARSLTARARVLQSFAAWNLGRIDEAKNAVRQAYRLYVEAGDPRGTASALNRQAIWLYEDGSLSDAIEAFEEALQISRDLGNADQVGRALNNVSLPLIERGDLRRAAERLEEAIQFSRVRAEPLFEAIALQNLAEVRALSGDLDSAAEFYDDAFRLLDELGHQRIQAYALAGLGEMLQRRGDYDAARLRLEESLRISQDLDNESYAARALFRLGELSFAEGDLQNARKRHQEALQRRVDLGENGRVAQSRIALARIDLQEDRPEDALNRLQEALPTVVEQKRRDDEILALSLLLEADAASDRPLERLRRLLTRCENPFVRDRAEVAIESTKDVS